MIGKVLLFLAVVAAASATDLGLNLAVALNCDNPTAANNQAATVSAGNGITLNVVIQGITQALCAGLNIVNGVLAFITLTVQSVLETAAGVLKVVLVPDLSKIPQLVSTILALVLAIVSSALVAVNNIVDILHLRPLLDGILGSLGLTSLSGLLNAVSGLLGGVAGSVNNLLSGILG